MRAARGDRNGLELPGLRQPSRLGLVVDERLELAHVISPRGLPTTICRADLHLNPNTDYIGLSYRGEANDRDSPWRRARQNHRIDRTCQFAGRGRCACLAFG